MKTNNDNKCDIPAGSIEATLPPLSDFVEQLAEDLCQIIRDEVVQKGFICPTFDVDPQRIVML